MRLNGKTILITGATSGFGKATAELAVREGARVIITGRREEKLRDLTSALGSDTCLPLCFDIQNNDDTLAALNSIPESWKPIDGLINNAGLALSTDKTPDVPLEDWEQMIDTNIKGLLYMTRALLPEMIERNRGHIVNIGSMAGNYPYSGGAVYGGSKAFVKQFSLALRTELLGTALRVTNLEPGLAKSEFAIVRLKDENANDEIYKGTEPLLPEDIAEAVIWCLSQPAHVNINRMEIMPVCQAAGGLAVHRS